MREFRTGNDRSFSLGQAAHVGAAIGEPAKRVEPEEMVRQKVVSAETQLAAVADVYLPRLIAAAEPTGEDRLPARERRGAYEEARRSVEQQIETAVRARNDAALHAVRHEVDAGDLLSALDQKVATARGLLEAAPPAPNAFELVPNEEAIAAEVAKSPRDPDVRAERKEALVSLFGALDPANARILRSRLRNPEPEDKTAVRFDATVAEPAKGELLGLLDGAQRRAAIVAAFAPKRSEGGANIADAARAGASQDASEVAVATPAEDVQAADASAASEPGRSWLDEEQEEDVDMDLIDPFGLGYDAGLAHDLPNACIVDTPTVAADALTGIHVWLQFDESRLKDADQAPPSAKFGPGRAGPYKINPYTRDGEVLFFIAYHTEREQREWVLGPDSVWNFATNVELYLGAAARFYPGSIHVAGSQADGANAVQNPDSAVANEAFGKAPWQQTLDAADEGLDYLNGGGGALNFARNARLRIADYVRPAKELANRLAADVASGKLDHLEARAQAVSGRNELLDHTRQRMSPAARYGSEVVKEEGKSLDFMTKKKVRDNLDAYRGGNPKMIEMLDADSELWAKYAAAVDAGDETMKAALRDLGQSPAVSNAIIKSAGNTNAKFTAIAKWGGPVGLVAGGLAAADMILDIHDAAEAENWHAAAGELGGFAGGLVGGELGAMGAVWIASLVPGVGAGVVIVVSIMGAIGGGTLGGMAGKSIVELLGDQGAYGSGLATGLGPAGGFAGVHSKDRLSGQSSANQIRDVIAETDAELARVSAAIPVAQNRDELETMQKLRLDVLARRQQLDDLLTAIMLGAFNEPEPPQECELPPPPPPDLCAADDDCDKEVD